MTYKPIERDVLVLTDEGKEILNNGTWEARLFRHVQKHPGIAPTDVSVSISHLCCVIL